jgi:phospholipid/cholesterol/gamma-HCH transport system permease protein
MTDFLAWLGRFTMHFLAQIGESGIFMLRTLLGPFSFKTLIQQLFSSGVLSLAIISVSGLFIGLVLGLQGYYTLSQFGASEALGQLIALSVVRELGPVVGALLFAGRAGSALTSEIGLMKATEQLDAMRMMGVDPIRRVIAPRFWAGQISLPILCLIFCMLAILGGYLIGVLWLGVSSGPFWGNMQSSVSFYDDICNGVIKTVVFGFVVTWISLFQGFTCEPTAAGIARATTNTVVWSSLAILALDFFLTAVMFK